MPLYKDKASIDEWNHYRGTSELSVQGKVYGILDAETSGNN